MPKVSFDGYRSIKQQRTERRRGHAGGGFDAAGYLVGPAGPHCRMGPSAPPLAATMAMMIGVFLLLATPKQLLVAESAVTREEEALLTGV
ncbi:hypothetical protein E2562_018734 [Oryza meyeriana var. granulata]|uniref:Uncharacterized protein n=1 Tax=Oryza meyeriana var. granulata TaxID=110450 RepID=A0A6G1EMT0_9ORYZ|nr:hypothetical protein E2562_018734 [Oryza meyeriana var. granulata]